MEKFIVSKSPYLYGTVKIGGSKNSVLPILAATILTGSECIIKEVPAFTDVIDIMRLIRDLGGETGFHNDTVVIRTQKVNKIEASYELVSKMRASFLLLGPLLARFGKAKIPLPGGCAIGSRPVDLHIKGLSALGAEILQEHGYVEASAKKLSGGHVYLDFPSVGATENTIMAAVLAEGQTVIQNCAVEPEIVDLSNFLNSCGGDVRGAGTDTVKINGVTQLHGCEHTIIPDRIEAGTFMAAAAVTRGKIIMENVVCDHVKPVIAKLGECGIAISPTENGLLIDAGCDVLPIDIKTLPYPGFPTDMQAQFMSFLVSARGTSVITETVFENRFMHAAELKRMGADIKIESRLAVIEGVPYLTGTQVKATDLRAGATLILAALASRGTTEIRDIHHIDRGYFEFDKKLQSLGAKIERVTL